MMNWKLVSVNTTMYILYDICRLPALRRQIPTKFSNTVLFQSQLVAKKCTMNSSMDVNRSWPACKAGCVENHDFQKLIRYDPLGKILVVRSHLQDLSFITEIAFDKLYHQFSVENILIGIYEKGSTLLSYIF